MILGIDVVFIHTKNPVKLAKWYKEKLNLEISFQTKDLSWQEFDMSTNISTRFALDYIGEHPSNIESQSIMISFKVENIEKTIIELEKKGVTFRGKEKVFDVGTSLVATFQDPEGNYLQLSQRKKT